MEATTDTTHEQTTHDQVLGGRYRVTGRAGSGGMATILLAMDQVLNREVALKRLHPGERADDAKRLRREARIGASLVHPNLVVVFDTIVSDDGDFIVMEYVDGRPLSELIRSGELDSQGVLAILEPLADALDYAHSNGVIHRDVKPANVLITHDGQVKLVDLGAATGADVTRVTAENEVIGTLDYIPPERLSGAAVGEAPSDIYALAVLAFEMLAGRRPWPKAEAAVHLARSQAGPPDLRERWPEIPPELAATLQRAMDPDPSRRQSSARALVSDISEALEPATTGTQALPAFEPAPPVSTSRNRRRWLGPAALAAVLVIAAAVVALASTGGGNDPNQPSAVASQSQGNDKATKGGPAEQPTETVTTTTPAVTTTTPAPAAADPSAEGSALGSQLNDQGYALIQDGRYEEAVPVLQRAVAAFPKGTTDLTYAYALFNLGHALRLAGDPQDAIPVLEQRLKIPDQTSTVQAELDAAEAAAGG
jgi:serine/threonine-protein kinase